MKIPRIDSFDIREWRALFKRRPERLGVEINGPSLRLARVKTEGDYGLVLSSYGDLDIDIWHAGAMEQQRVKSAVRQLGEGITRVAVNIEHPTMRIRRMSFAKMPEGDLLEAIRWNFREQIEGSIADYVVGHTPLEGFAEPNKVTIMAYGVAQEAIKEHINLMKSLGLKVVSLEPAATALLTAFYANGVLSDGKCHVCISFGELMTQLTVMKGNSLLFSRPLAGVSNDALTKLVMRNLNMEEGEARSALKAFIDSSSEGASAREPSEDAADAPKTHQIETTMGHFLSQLAIEIQRSIDAFCIMYGVDRVDDIYVCGGGVAYPGLVAHMRTTLGIETLVFNPFKRLMPLANQSEEIMRKASVFSVAVGLAIP